MKAKKKSFMTFAICGALALLGVIIGLTSAWFTSTVTATGTIKTGTLAVDLSVKTISGETIVPGATIVDTFKVIDSSGKTDIDCYLRVQITVSGASSASVTIGSLTGWVQKDGETANVWYYGTSATNLTRITPNVLKAGINVTNIKFANTTNTADNALQGKQATITIYADVIQADYANANTPQGFDTACPRH